MYLGNAFGLAPRAFFVKTKVGILMLMVTLRQLFNFYIPEIDRLPLTL
jgi:hypothetical protein